MPLLRRYKMKSILQKEVAYKKKTSVAQTVRTSNGVSNEAELFMYQLLSDESEDIVLQQRITSLGCSMEALRSSLPTWVYWNPIGLRL